MCQSKFEPTKVCVLTPTRPYVVLTRIRLHPIQGRIVTTVPNIYYKSLIANLRDTVIVMAPVPAKALNKVTPQCFFRSRLRRLKHPTERSIALSAVFESAARLHPLAPFLVESKASGMLLAALSTRKGANERTRRAASKKVETTTECWRWAPSACGSAVHHHLDPTVTYASFRFNPYNVKTPQWYQCLLPLQPLQRKYTTIVSTNTVNEAALHLQTFAGHGDGG